MENDLKFFNFVFFSNKSKNLATLLKTDQIPVIWYLPCHDLELAEPFLSKFYFAIEDFNSNMPAD